MSHSKNIRVLHITFALFLLGTSGCAQKQPKTQPPSWSAPPDVASFEKIENDHLEAMQRAIDKLLGVKERRTVENTLAPYDDALMHLEDALGIATLIQSAHPDKSFRDRATTMLTQATDAGAANDLNPLVSQALSNLDVSKADPITRYYVQRQLLELRHGGVDKDDVTRERLKKLYHDLTSEQSAFKQNFTDDKPVGVVELAGVSDLAGLPQDYIDRHQPDVHGKIRIGTFHQDSYPVMSFAKSESLRRRLWTASFNHGYPKNRDVLNAMLETSYEIATLLGYSSWADYYASDKMIRSSKNIQDFIQQLDVSIRPAADRETKILLDMKRKEHPQANKVFDYDEMYLQGLVRRSRYNFDSQVLAPYFPYNQVKQGVLDAAAKLFHVTFRLEPDPTAWDPSVEIWDVIDNGRLLGRFYLDMHPRLGKTPVTENVSVLNGRRGGQVPEVVLLCSFPIPHDTDPGLMDYEAVVTFFHEFGHSMHYILGGQQQWVGISGASMEWDFGEAPSKMLEELMHSPQVLALFAHNYKSGEPIPSDLEKRMNHASAFGRAGSVSQQLAFTAYSYDVYKSKPANVDVDALWTEDCQRYFPKSRVMTPGLHRWASFYPVVQNTSAYYTYLFDKVIAEDFFEQFDKEDLFAGDTPMRYRHLVLEPGGSMSANDLVRNFLGRPQNTDAFQRWLAEEFEGAPDIKKPHER